MNIRISYFLRTSPLLIYSVLVLYTLTIMNGGERFDFWTPLISLSNIVNWVFAGLLNILFVFLFGNFIRNVIVKYSYQDLNEYIPQSDIWERTQFNLIIISFFVVLIAGFGLTLTLINNEIFQLVLFGWTSLLIIQDLAFHYKWVLF